MVPGCGRPGAKHRHEVRPEEAPRPRVATEGLCGTSGGTRMCGSPTAAKAPRASPARGQGAATPAPPRGAQRAVGCGEPQPQRGKPHSASRAQGLAAWGPGVPARLGAGPGCRLQLAGAAHAAVGGLGWAGLGWVGAAAADSYGAIAQTCLTGTAPCGSACAPGAAAAAHRGRDEQDEPYLYRGLEGPGGIATSLAWSPGGGHEKQSWVFAAEGGKFRIHQRARGVSESDRAAVGSM